MWLLWSASEDSLLFVSGDALLKALKRYLSALELLELNRVYDRYNPHCEFKLDTHNLHPTTGGQKKQPRHLDNDNHESFEYQLSKKETKSGDTFDAINWLMFGCDGETSLFELAEQSEMPVRTLHQAAQEMLDAGSLKLSS